MRRLVAVGLGVILAGGGGRTGALATPAVAPALVVPRVEGAVKIDAELEGKKVWEADVGATGNFKDARGQGMVPYTEAKLRWGNGKLYLMLYAGDLDLEGRVRTRDGAVDQDDAFRLEFGDGSDTRVIWVSLLGTLADARCRPVPGGRVCDAGWNSHARVAVDRDGTLNRIGDNDEEWVVEMAIPLAVLGVTNARPGTRIAFAVSRCEIGNGRQRGCGGWGIGQRGWLTLGR